MHKVFDPRSPLDAESVMSALVTLHAENVRRIAGGLSYAAVVSCMGRHPTLRLEIVGVLTNDSDCSKHPSRQKVLMQSLGPAGRTRGHLLLIKVWRDATRRAGSTRGGLL
jgi:hypothetical protein